MDYLASSRSLERSLIFLFCSMGCVACFYLQKSFLLPNYLASASVGFVGSFIPQSRFFDSKQLIAAVYTGSFASMCSLSFFSRQYDLLTLCFIVGASFIALSPFFKGFGGKLGTIGFVASFSFICVKALL